MQIIKDHQLTENTWQFIDDEAELPKAGNITVSLNRWNQEQALLQQHDGQIGVRLTSTDNTDSIQSLHTAALIELDFPVFTDGRLFSHARLLRSQQSYAGEIRAVGQFMVDQVFYLSRVGVNSFVLPAQSLPVGLAALNDFSVQYQSSTH